MPEEMAQLEEVATNERAAEIIAGAVAFMRGGDSPAAEVAAADVSATDAAAAAAAAASDETSAEVSEG